MRCFWGVFLLSVGVAFAADTDLMLYRPFGGGVLQQDPLVQKTLPGECVTQSMRLVREDAYRCVTAQGTFDPCFIKPTKDRLHAVCPASPWNGAAIDIMLTSAPAQSGQKPLDASTALPWAVELDGGEHCIAFETAITHEGSPLGYHCGGNVFLARHIQRCGKPWKILRIEGGVAKDAIIDRVWF
ncbi:hypothetical protein Lgee_0620 [Legionella geestiana]|uniref:Uncharacterized protein n=1 Tax=Legionella geestiana TaxID=45065 RepID=A0A0W0U4X4_9GAMM|nr:hypothetical protein [Legionella geestiana]KTD02885.1 hypothetical protein Lgee_0620 [Legionella geestiana]QBS11678.1 hypothetical protein E4T54_02385 [Legionella geestiana]QDQ40711.1 hypothetical protein E3226_010035 [Legionella geestiana]STX53635.1 Uncharacterised protein [Legionella geestiana]